MYGQYRKAMTNRDYLPRSREQVDECRQYIFTTSGGVEHSRAVNAMDPSGARANHGDRPLAAALCVEARVVTPVVEHTEPVIPLGSLMHRRKQADSRRLEKAYW